MVAVVLVAVVEVVGVNCRSSSPRRNCSPRSCLINGDDDGGDEGDGGGGGDDHKALGSSNCSPHLRKR